MRYGDWEGRCYGYLYESNYEEEPEEDEGALVGDVGAGDTAVQRRHGGATGKEILRPGGS